MLNYFSVIIVKEEQEEKDGSCHFLLSIDVMAYADSVCNVLLQIRWRFLQSLHTRRIFRTCSHKIVWNMGTVSMIADLGWQSLYINLHKY